MKVAIVGAGCLGFFLGGIFHKYFEDNVILFGRPESETTRLVEKARCVKITNFDFIPEGFTVFLSKTFQYSTELSKSTIGDCDVVLICVETTQTEIVCEKLTGLVKKDATIVSIQNGIGHAETIKKYFANQNVLSSVVFFNVLRKVENGIPVYHNGTHDRLLKISDTSLGSRSKLDNNISRWFLERNVTNVLDIVLVDNILGHQYHKLLFNLYAAVNVISGSSLADTLKDQDYRRVMAESVKEALKVYEAAKIKIEYNSLKHSPELIVRMLPLPNLIFQVVAKNTIEIDPEAKFSMLQMLESGKKTEIDDINGIIVEMGKKFKISTPINSKLVDLVHLAEKNKKSPQISGKKLAMEVLTNSSIAWTMILIGIIAFLLVYGNYKLIRSYAQ